MHNTFLEIIKSARKNGFDPVTAIMEYLEEKDSRVTRIEAERIVARLTKPAKPEQKKIFAISKARYRSVMIFETASWFVIFLGMKKYAFGKLAEATAFIDLYYAMKRN